VADGNGLCRGTHWEVATACIGGVDDVDQGKEEEGEVCGQPQPSFECNGWETV
jgi:hypothetical protein